MHRKLYRVSSVLGHSTLALVLLLLACSSVNRTPAAKSIAQDAKLEQPEKITVCELKNGPAKFNHKLIEVTGFVSHGFEDFALFDPACPGWPPVWLEYGGENASGTMYCCGVTAARTRPEQITVENIPITLLVDEHFREFDKLIHRPPDSIVHGTIVGRFFAGEEEKFSNGSHWAGYGHMGCCSLLMIQQVLSVNSQDRADVDYRATSDQPDGEKASCYRILREAEDDLVESQRQADQGSRAWAFNDPKRVAVNALMRSLKLETSSSIDLKQIKQSQGRIVYEWKPREQKVSYMVVVSRPYVLSFFSSDPEKVAWTAIAAYQVGC